MTVLPLLFAALAGATPEAASPPPTPGAAPRAPELVVIPPSAKAPDEKASRALLDALLAELEKSRDKLGVSTTLAKAQRDFLVGPARDRARECKGAADCLAGIAATLGADVLVTGELQASEISLFAIGAGDGRRLADVRVAGKKAKATKLRAQAITALLGQLGEAGAAAMLAAGQAALRPKVEEAPVPVVALGALALPASALQGVSQILVDGAVVPFSSSGEVRWEGTPGTHTVVAVRLDGQRTTQEVFVRPGETSTLALTFAEVAPVEAGEGDAPGATPTDRWWFWAALVTAVAAGSATAAALASGDKGGPALPTENGTLRGTY